VTRSCPPGAPRTSFGIVGAEVKRRADGLVAFEPAPLAGPQDTAAGSRDRGVGELGDQSPQPVGIRPAVAVEEGEKVAPALPAGEIASPRRTHRLGEADQAHAVAHLERERRAVVHHRHFQTVRRVVKAGNRFQAGGKLAGSIADRDQERDGGPVGGERAQLYDAQFGQAPQELPFPGLQGLQLGGLPAALQECQPPLSHLEDHERTLGDHQAALARPAQADAGKQPAAQGWRVGGGDRRLP